MRYAAEVYRPPQIPLQPVEVNASRILFNRREYKAIALL